MNRIPTSLPPRHPIHGQLIMWDQIIYLEYTTINLISHFFFAFASKSGAKSETECETKRWLDSAPMINGVTKGKPVVSKVIRMEVLNGEDVLAATGKHRAAICWLQQERVLIPNDL